MRQALAKSIRRDLRRAFGADAIGVFDQQSAAVESQDAILKAVRIDVAELKRAAREELAAIREELRMVRAAAFDEPETLWGRLRWLVTGR